MNRVYQTFNAEYENSGIDSPVAKQNLNDFRETFYPPPQQPHQPPPLQPPPLQPPPRQLPQSIPLQSSFSQQSRSQPPIQSTHNHQSQTHPSQTHQTQTSSQLFKGNAFESFQNDFEMPTTKIDFMDEGNYPQLVGNNRSPPFRGDCSATGTCPVPLRDFSKKPDSFKKSSRSPLNPERTKVNAKINRTINPGTGASMVDIALRDIMSRPGYDMGYICTECNLSQNGHNSIQPKFKHQFVPGVYRKLLPFEYGPWADGVPLIN